MPRAIRSDFAQLRRTAAPGVPDEVLSRGLSVWAQVLGGINLEMFGHLHNVISRLRRVLRAADAARVRLLAARHVIREPRASGVGSSVRSGDDGRGCMHDAIVEVDGLWKTFGRGQRGRRPLVRGGARSGLRAARARTARASRRRCACSWGSSARHAARRDLFGEPVTPSCPQLARVGAMVEQAAFVPHLSGMRNLRLWWEAGGRRMQRRRSRRRARDRRPRRRDRPQGEDVLAGDEAAPRIRAPAARRGPSCCVLDEPTNGLDPGEIREIRELIGRLSAHGATVLLSSHHLSEVEQVCSHVLVMNRGRLVADGTVSELDRRRRARSTSRSTTVNAPGPCSSDLAGGHEGAEPGRRPRHRAARRPAFRSRGRARRRRAPARDDHADATARRRVPRPPRRRRRGAIARPERAEVAVVIALIRTEFYKAAYRDAHAGHRGGCSSVCRR